MYLFAGAILLMLICPGIIMSQNISISENGSTTPDPSSMLDIVSASKGLLVPRVQLSATNVAAPVSSPANSLLVYNTQTAGSVPNNVIPGFYFWSTDDSKWHPIASRSGWELLGNSGTDPTINFLGTTDAKDLVIRTNNTEKLRVLSGGNVGIGTATPNYLLHLHSTSNPVNLLQLTNTNSGDATTDGFKINLSSGKVELINQENNSLSFFTNATEKVTILNDGNVGIGVLSPADKLDVNGTVQFSGQLEPDGLPGTAGQILVSQGPSASPVWSTVGSVIQAVGCNSTKTLVSSTYNPSSPGTFYDMTLVTGLTKSVSVSTSAMLFITTTGAIETKATNSSGGSGTVVQVFQNDVAMANAMQTVDVANTSGYIQLVTSWAITTWVMVTPGTYTFKVRAAKYIGSNFNAGGSDTSPIGNEGVMTILVIPQ